MGTLVTVVIIAGIVAFALRTWGSIASQMDRKAAEAKAAPKGDRLARDSEVMTIPHPPKLLWLIPVAFVAVPALLTSFVTINAGHVGVVTRFGAATGNVFEQGLHTKVPYIEDVVIFNVQIQKEQVKAEAASHDLQDVHADVALNYHLERDPKAVVEVFVTIGPGYKERTIDPAIQEAFKATTSQFTAKELITDREAVKTKARETLKQQLARFHVIVDELNIVNFEFSKEFTAAIERKQVAEQDAETAKNKLLQVETEARQRVKQAQADKEAIELNAQGRANATKTEADAQAYAQEKLRPNLNDLYLQWLTLQNQANAIKQWDGKLPQYNMSNAQPFINLPAPTK